MEVVFCNELPKEKRNVVYLDYNVFVELMEDANKFKLLELILEKDMHVFPYSIVHINEVNRISDLELVKKHLSVIKIISKDNFIDFNENLKTYTIRPRDPFEVYDTINEVPKEFLKKIYKTAINDIILPSFENFPRQCESPEQLFGFFAKMFRGHFPGISQELNNLNRLEAVKYLETRIFNGFSMEELYKLINSSISDWPCDFDFFVDNTLYMAGYITPNKDLKKPDGLLSDHQHIQYAIHCGASISSDRNFRKKIISKSEGSYFSMNLTDGLIFLLLDSGVANAKSSITGEDLTLSCKAGLLTNKLMLLKDSYGN